MSESVHQVNWNYPTSIRAGAGRIEELPEACGALGMHAPLLVTDPQLATLPMVITAAKLCQANGLACGVFSAIRSNPNDSNIGAGVQAYIEGGHDGVIAMGGGSALDAGKAVALMAGQELSLWELEDIGDNWLRIKPEGIAPVVAVPTTAGTGSEVGRAAVITDQRAQVKRIIFHPGMLPGQVILDPELSLALPPHLTAATGMDALSHNLEALCSPAWHPMADGIAMEGLRLVHSFLPTAVHDGANVEARMHMLAASAMGATAFQKGLGAMHALAHPLGAVYDAHHGLLNAILMPYVLHANRASIEHTLQRAAGYLGLEQQGFEGFLQWILDLRTEIGIPNDLAAIGIDDTQIDKLARMAVEDPSAGGNPISFDAARYEAILRKAIKGDL